MPGLSPGEFQGRKLSLELPGTWSQAVGVWDVAPDTPGFESQPCHLLLCDHEVVSLRTSVSLPATWDNTSFHRL